jgi:ureidoacrylate peracid hydrolase
MDYGDLEYRLDPSRAALVVVDVQNDFCGPVSVTGVVRDNSAMVAMCSALDGLIPAARAANVPVIYVRTVHDHLADSPVWRSRRPEPYLYEDELCKPGTDGIGFACTPPLPGEAVVTKRRYDAFIGTDLDHLLRSMGREAIVATGCLTDICVETAVRHAVSLDYFVTVASDACASFTNEAHEQALSRIGRAFGKVADSQSIASIWKIGAQVAA